MNVPSVGPVQRRAGRQTRAVAAIAVIASLAASCGGQTGSSVAPGTSGAASATATSGATGTAIATQGEKSTLTFWIHGADPFIKAHKGIVAQYEAANPSVHIDLQSFPFADFNTKVVSSLPAGSGPDILEAYSPWMVGYIRTGLIDKVPATFGTADQVVSRYYESTLSLLKYKSEYFGVPSNVAAGSTRVILVNDKVVGDAKVSVDDNKTFEDWIADWKNLTTTDASGKVTRAGLGQMSGQPADQFVSYILEYGGSLYDATGRKAGFNSDAGKKALTLLSDLVNKDKVDSPELTDFPAIANGTAATGYRGTWVIPEYQKDAPDFKFHYLKMPLPPGATVESWQGGSGWATYVPAASKNKDAAWAFVKFVEDHRKTWIDDTSEIPADKKLAAQEAEEKPNIYGVYFPILEQSKHGYPFGDYFVIYKALSDMVTSVVLGQASVDEALTTAETAVNQHLDQWWKQYPE